MAEEKPVTAPAEAADQPERTPTTGKPADKESENGTASDNKAVGKKDSIRIPQSSLELLLEAFPRSGQSCPCATRVR